MASIASRQLSLPIIEFFSLQKVSRRVAAIDPSGRIRLSRNLRLSRQQREAAETLWAAGSAAEALRLAKAAFDTAVQEATAWSTPSPNAPRSSVGAAEAYETGVAEPEDTADIGQPPAQTVGVAPASEGRVDPALLSEAARAGERANLEGLPVFDAEVGDDHIRVYRELLEVHQRLIKALVPFSLEERDVRSLRIWRVLVAIGALGLLIALAVTLIRWANAPKVEASASYPGYEAQRAVDGSLSSEWFLPDHQPGYLDLILRRPRKVHRVRITNAANVPHLDRASMDLEVEVIRGGQTVKKLETKFAELKANPPPAVLEINEPGVERIRINVKSYHRMGGGLAEVVIE